MVVLTFNTVVLREIRNNEKLRYWHSPCQYKTVAGIGMPLTWLRAENASTVFRNLGGNDEYSWV